MNSGLSLEQRLQIVYEIYLVIGEDEEVHKAESPKADAYWLVRAVIQDKTYPINTRTLLCRVLKKSPVWRPLLPFLVNGDIQCQNKDCEHGPHQHVDGKCKGQKYIGWDPDKRVSIYTPCNCTAHIQKTL